MLAPESGREALHRALSEVARAIADSLELKEVWDRVAETCRAVVPFDGMGVSTLEADGRVRVLAVTDVPAAQHLTELVFAHSDYSPGYWPDQGDFLVLVHDSRSELDPAFAVDRDVIERGFRSILRLPLGRGQGRSASLQVIEWDCMLAHDITVLEGNRARIHLINPQPRPPSIVDVQLDDFWIRVYSEMGIRSLLRANIRLSGVAIGGLLFGSRKPTRFDDDQAEFAMRVADHVALAIAHQQLAEESRRTTEAQHRAAQLEERVQVLAHELEEVSPHRALGRSKKWKDVLSQATKVAPTDTTVLMTGESGTGKEVVARFIHRGSSRKDGPFVALNCAALPEQLLESELFGHEKGAFTGAFTARPGKIEQASGGVLFLDEVGEMSPRCRRSSYACSRSASTSGWGARAPSEPTPVYWRPNRNLKSATAQGAFREDLYYRLAVFDIPLPPLRDRAEDIPLLVDAFLEQIGRSVGRPAAGVSQEARAKLLAYWWPGNVRELRNAIERAVILCEAASSRANTSRSASSRCRGPSWSRLLLRRPARLPPSPSMPQSAS